MGPGGPGPTSYDGAYLVAEIQRLQEGPFWAKYLYFRAFNHKIPHNNN